LRSVLSVIFCFAVWNENALSITSLSLHVTLPHQVIPLPFNFVS
jgi:hypothetical protein